MKKILVLLGIFALLFLVFAQTEKAVMQSENMGETEDDRTFSNIIVKVEAIWGEDRYRFPVQRAFIDIYSISPEGHTLVAEGRTNNTGICELDIEVDPSGETFYATSTGGHFVDTYNNKRKAGNGTSQPRTLYGGEIGVLMLIEVYEIQ